MNPATAAARLRRALFWSLLVETGRAACFRCGDMMSETTWSIDHVVPYLDAEADLFWDAKNIAYSHISCNSSAARRVHKHVAPEGMAWCNGHKTMLPLTSFNKNRSRWNGVHDACRACSKPYVDRATARRSSVRRARRAASTY